MIAERTATPVDARQALADIDALFAQVAAALTCVTTTGPLTDDQRAHLLAAFVIVHGLRKGFTLGALNLVPVTEES